MWSGSLLCWGICTEHVFISTASTITRILSCQWNLAVEQDKLLNAASSHIISIQWGLTSLNKTCENTVKIFPIFTAWLAGLGSSTFDSNPLAWHSIKDSTYILFHHECQCHQISSRGQHCFGFSCAQKGFKTYVIELMNKLHAFKLNV